MTFMLIKLVILEQANSAEMFLHCNFTPQRLAVYLFYDTHNGVTLQTPRPFERKV